MNDLRTAAQQALERLRKYHHGNGFAEDAECIADLEAALAQQAEPVEPVATLGYARRIEELIAQRDALLEALRALVRNEGLDPYSYLDKGIGTATAAGQRWLNARAAIKAVEEGK